MANNLFTDIVDEGKLNACTDILAHAEEIIGDSILNEVPKYTIELDSVMNIMHSRVERDDYEITDKELEKLTVRLPIIIYRLNDLLMQSSIREDLAKVIKQTHYNQNFGTQVGTIADKKSAAELQIKEESLLETVWKLTVKSIAGKIDIARDFLSSCKKIMSKRMADREIEQMGRGTV